MSARHLHSRLNAQTVTVSRLSSPPLASFPGLPRFLFFGLCSVQGRRKQSPDGQAQLDVGGEAVNNSRAKRSAKIWTLVFFAVRRRSHCTSALKWDSKAWKFSHTEVSLMRAHLGTYPAEFYYSKSRPHKCRTRNYFG